MICFKKIKPRKIRKVRKSKAGQEALDKLNSFIDKESPAPAFFLARTWNDQQKAITYKELRQAILNGYMDEETLMAWQQDYSVFVNQYMAPSWYKAMEAAAGDLDISGKTFQYDPMWSGITDWVKNHSAQFVTNASDEQRKAISALLSRAYMNGDSAEELSKVIRPCIGLTERQAIANQKYYERKKKEFSKKDPKTAEKKAREEAAKYAERQHRYRAQVIAETEMAYAYNEGHYQAIKMAQSQGLLGEVHKVWSTAADELVCDYCGSLEVTEIDIDDKFCVTNGKKSAFVLYPPAHPSCRCAFEIKELTPPKQVQQEETLPLESGNQIFEIPRTADTQIPILENNRNACTNITDEWLAPENRSRGNVTDLKSYKAQGIEYKVDDWHVVLDYSDREKEVAALIAEETGKDVELVPRILYPKGIQTSDYIIEGERYDLKEPTGTSKNLLYNMLSKKKKQANNFVIDITKCLLTEQEILCQVDNLYTSSHMRFIQTIILINGDKILHVFERNET